MPLHIVRDDDARTFTLDGDTLLLRAFVRQRDLEAVEKAERDAAFASVAEMESLGVDLAKLAENAAPSDDADTQLSAAVRRARLSALAISLTAGGQTYAGDALMAAYDDMDTESAAWVDAQVDSVWTPSTVTDAEGK